MSAAPDGQHTNPFPGLRPFRQDEEHLFFGRENQVDAMVNKLAETRFLAVVGTSGSGKSSLVNCGLRPALRRGLMARAGTAWRMAKFRPGNEPIVAMARALAKEGVLFREDAAADMPLAEIIETTLHMSKLGLIDIWEQAALGDGVNLLVVVDQFEELFRYRQLEATGDYGISEQATAFVNLLLEVKEHANCRIFVVLTMRSDFLGDCTKFPGLAEASNAGQYLVPRMTRDERRAAIECPVEVGGAEISPVLLTRLVNDVGDNPDQLSILQHALNRTWARWQGEGGKGPLDLVHYKAIGTMAHALDRHAERAFAELTGERRSQICENLFKALTDKATDPRGVRRPTTLATLCALADATAAEVTEVIEVFRKPSRSFLMPPAGEELKASSVVDISHESLMRVWERLKKWTDEEAQSARTYRRLADTADLHAAGNANLWRDPELQLALNWREKNRPNEAWGSRYHPGFAAAMQFLSASSEGREAEREEQRQRRQRELDAEHEKAATQAKMTKLAGSAALFFLALAAVAVFLWQEAKSATERAQSATESAQLYQSEAQTSQALSLVKSAGDRPNDHTRKMLLALETLPDVREGIERPIVSEAKMLVAKAIDDLHEREVHGPYSNPLGVAIIGGQNRVLTRSEDSNAVEIRDFGNGDRLLQLAHEAVRTVAVTSDSQRIITASDDTTRIWDAETGVEMHKLVGHGGRVLAVAATLGGDRVVTGLEDGTARLLDVRSNAELLKLVGHTEPILDVAITPDGSRIVTGSNDRTARVWDVSKGGAGVRQLGGHTGVIVAVAISSDGTRAVTGSEDGTARIWEADTSAPARQLSHGSRVSGVAFSEDGSRVFTSSDDGTVRVWDASTGARLMELGGHTAAVRGMAESPDGNRLMTTSEDGTARTWDVQTDRALFQLRGHTEPVSSVAVTPDGARILSGGSDGTARLWDAKTGVELLKVGGGRGNPIWGVTITPDGTRIVTGSNDRTATVWDGKTGDRLLKLEGHDRVVRAVAVTPDGARIITGSDDRTARVWDASTGAQLLKLEGHTSAVLAVAVTPDGAGIVTGSGDRTIRVWDVKTGTELRKFEGHDGAVRALTINPDGTRIVAGLSDGTTWIWDAKGGPVPTKRLVGHGPSVRSVAVTPDGSRIVTGSDDRTLRIWDALEGTELSRGKTGGSVWSLAVTPDGSRVITGSGDSTVRVWALARFRAPPEQHRFDSAADLQALVENAKAAVPRCLTIEERKDFLLRPTPPGWCIDMRKYPYTAKYWNDWKAGSETATDETTAQAFTVFADKALMEGGAIRIAEQAAQLSIKFDPFPKKVWRTINLAHANMLLNRTTAAREGYLAYLKDSLAAEDGKSQRELVLDDFKKLRDMGREKPLLKEMEQAFRDAPVKSGK